MRYSPGWIVPRILLTSCPLFLGHVCPDEVVGLKIYTLRLFPVPWLLVPIPKLVVSQLTDFLCCSHSFSDCGVERGRVEFASVTRRRNYANSIEIQLTDSLRVLGLEPGVTIREINVRYIFLARRLHPDKHDPEITGMTSEESVEQFKRVNNAQQFIHDSM